MEFKQKVTKEVIVKIKPKYNIWDVVVYTNEMWTIFINPIQHIKISDWLIKYYIEIHDIKFYILEKDIKLYK